MADVEMIRCPSCETTNRVPLEQIHKGRMAVCGRCGRTLQAQANVPLTITDANFSSQVEQSSLPVLLDLWAPWCGPCRMVAPVVEQLASEMAGRLRVGKVNVDENPAISGRFQVRGIPALLVIKGGQEIDRIIGAQPKAEIVRRLEQALR